MENKTTTDHDHVTSQEFNKLEPGSLTSKNDIDNLVNEDRYW